MANTISTSTNATATAYTPAKLVAMSASGDALVVWFDGTNVKWSYASSPYSSWTTATLISSLGGGPRWQAGMHKLSNDNAVLVTSNAAGNIVSYLFTYSSGSHNWSAGSAVTVLSSGSASNGGSVAMDIDAQGRIWAAWSNNSNVIQIYETANNGTSWSASTTLTQVSGGENGNIGLAYCGNYIVCVFCASGAAYKYARVDAHSASIGSWSVPAAVTNCNFDNTLISSSFRGAPGSNYGVFVGDLFAAIPAQYYNANTDAWSTVTNIGGASTDQKPTLVTDGTDLYCVWCLRAGTNNYSLVYKKWTASSQTWDSSNTQLEASGTNIQWPSGGYGNSTLGFVYTVGTATPWNVNFDTKSFPSGVALSVTMTGTGALTETLSLSTALSDTLAGAGALTGTFSLSTALTDTLAGAGTLTGTLTITAVFLTGEMDGVGILSATVSLSTALSSTLAGTGTLSASPMGLATSLSDTLAGAGALTATPGLATSLTSTPAGDGALAGTLSLSTALSATLAGVGTLSGSLSTPGSIHLSATFTGSGTLAGSMSLQTSLTGTFAGSGMLLAALVATTSLGSTLAGNGSISGTLSLTMMLSALFAGAGLISRAQLSITLPFQLPGIATVSDGLHGSAAIMDVQIDQATMTDVEMGIVILSDQG